MTNIRLALDDYGDQMLFIEFDDYTDFVEGDQITIYGEIFGAHTYTSQAGWDITLPAIVADSIE